jgi:predicted transposase YbfD/YdcC
VKNEYKKLLLEKLVNDKVFEVKRLIERSISLVQDSKAISCARNGREAIEK